MQTHTLKYISMVLTVIYIMVRGSQALPSGAPSTACATMMPQGPHSPAGAMSSPSNYIVNISDFANGGGGFSYIPGQSYSSRFCIHGIVLTEFLHIVCMYVCRLDYDLCCFHGRDYDIYIYST